MKIKAISFALLVLFTSGCSLPFNLSSPPKSYYKLTIKSQEKVFETHPWRIGVRDVVSDGFVDSHKVLFTNEGGEVGYYQFASWVDSPARALTDGLLLSLDSSRLFQFVSRTTSGAIFDFQINGDLFDFSYKTSPKEEVIHIMFRAELIDLRSREVIATKLFEISEPVLENNIDGAISSFNKGSEILITQIISWINESLPNP